MMKQNTNQNVYDKQAMVYDGLRNQSLFERPWLDQFLQLLTKEEQAYTRFGLWNRTAHISIFYRTGTSHHRCETSLQICWRLHKNLFLSKTGVVIYTKISLKQNMMA